MKNPPQYPHIIDLENKNPSGTKQDATQPSTVVTEAAAPNLATDLVRSIDALAGEVRQLVNEMRALNVRQQAQIDMLRLTRNDLRIDNYERELKGVTDRLAQLQAEEQSIRAGLTPEALEMQANRFGSLNRDQTIQQIRSDLEARLLNVVTEKERLEQRNNELQLILMGLREGNAETERKILLVEEALRQLTALPLTQSKEAQPETKPEEKPEEKKPEEKSEEPVERRP